LVGDFFDKIYVISIPTSTRKNELIENFKRAKIENYEIIDFNPASKVVNVLYSTDLKTSKTLS
jgi:hypothetical protein